MDRSPFTERVRASEFQEDIPGLSPGYIRTDFEDTHENTTLVATDGKKDDEKGLWGVGVTSWIKRPWRHWPSTGHSPGLVSAGLCYTTLSKGMDSGRSIGK